MNKDSHRGAGMVNTFKNVFSGIVIIFLLTLVNSNLCAQNCNRLDWDKNLQRIRTYLKQYRITSGISFADSVMESTPKEVLDNCLQALIFRLERGELLELTKRFDVALDEYYNILYKAEDNKWWNLLALCHISTARCHEAIGRRWDSKRHLDSSLELIGSKDLDTIMATYAYRYASYLRLFEDIDSAYYYAEKAVILGNKYEIPRAVYDGHLILGILSKDMEEACYHFRNSASKMALAGNYYGASRQMMNVAKKYAEVGRVQEANAILDTAGMYAQRIDKENKIYDETIARLYDRKSLNYKKMGLIDSAYYYLLLSRDLDLSSDWTIEQDSITKNVLEFAIEKQKEKNEYLEKSTMLFRWAFIASIIGFILFMVLFAMNRKRNKKIVNQNTIIQNQNSALELSYQKQSTLLSEVHHRVKNNLQLVISLLTLHGRNQKDDNFNKLMDEVSGKVKSIALIHEQLYSSGEFEIINVQEYLGKLMDNFKTLQSEKDAFEYTIEADEIYFNLETVLPIGIIASELISNALKYARIKDTTLQLYMGIKIRDNKYLFKYTDNGPGMSEASSEDKGHKIGISLIKSMIRQLQAESKSFNQDGYHFTILFEQKFVSKL